MSLAYVPRRLDRVHDKSWIHLFSGKYSGRIRDLRFVFLMLVAAEFLILCIAELPEKSDDLAANGQAGAHVVIGREEDYTVRNPCGSTDKVGSAARQPRRMLSVKNDSISLPSSFLPVILIREGTND